MNEAFIHELKYYSIPENPKEIEADDEEDLADLNQEDRLYSVVTDKGLHSLPSNLKTDCQLITRTIGFHLPPYLNPLLWCHYRLSQKQVYELLNSYNAMMLWALCILLKINISSPALRASTSTSTAIICSASHVAKTRLKEFLTKNYSKIPASFGDVFFETSHFPEDQHRPQLPVFLVSTAVMETLIQALPPYGVIDNAPMRSAIPITKCFLIRGKKYIAYELHSPPPRVLSNKKKRKYSHSTYIPAEPRRFLLMVRIVSAFTYISTYGPSTSLSLDPLYFTLKNGKGEDELFCGLDQCIYLTKDQPPQAVVLQEDTLEIEFKKPRKKTKRPPKKKPKRKNRNNVLK